MVILYVAVELQPPITAKPSIHVSKSDSKSCGFGQASTV